MCFKQIKNKTKRNTHTDEIKNFQTTYDLVFLRCQMSLQKGFYFLMYLTVKCPAHLRLLYKWSSN